MEKAENIYTISILEKLYRNCCIPVSVYMENGECIFHLDEHCSNSVYELDLTLYEDIRAKIMQSDEPIICMEDTRVFHGGFVTDSGHCIIWGPLTLKELSPVEAAAYRRLHGVKDKQIHIHRSSYAILSNIISIAFAFYCKKDIKEEEIRVIWEDYKHKFEVNVMEMEDYYIDKSDMNRTHDSIYLENKYIEAVMRGDVQEMKRFGQINGTDVVGVGEVAKKAFKQHEYLNVTCIILVSRAAVKGGMNPELAYDLSDIYLQKIEKCKSIEELRAVRVIMQMDYTERVHNIRKQKRGNIHVERCKDYIANHLRRGINVQKMAEALDLNRTYLARIFKEQESISIQEYIKKERCEHAANMLKFTQYDISVIAEYFCFSTQSHFGKQFRSVYGITPNEYRRENRVIKEFINSNEQ